MKVGDIVLIDRAKYFGATGSRPGWAVDDMDRYLGKIAKIIGTQTSSSGTEFFSIEGTGYVWTGGVLTLLQGGTKSVDSKGAHCSKCATHAPYANADPSFVCWSCTNYPFYTTRAR